MKDISYKRYVLAVLTAVYTLSFMDRNLVGILMQSIKDELFLSDTQLGFLTGIAFALFYATLGIPIARFADHGNRVTIISIAMALWGAMVMLCGAVTNFFQLVLVRIGAAVGEAGCMPPSYSLIGDYFNSGERARALSIFMSGISASVLLSFILAGWINDTFGWRMAFLVVGIPGLFVAILAKLTIREPRKCLLVKQPASKERKQSLRKIALFVWRHNTLRNLLVAVTIAHFVGIGVSQWFAVFFIRIHDVSTSELGIWMGLGGGVGGAVATYGAGSIAARWMPTNYRLQLILIALGVALLLPVNTMMLFVGDKLWALSMLVPAYMIGLFLYGPILAIIQQLVPNEIRATTMAINLLIWNLIGMGLGPQTVGLLSDVLTPAVGELALPVGMAFTTLFIFVASYFFWQASKSISDDLSGARKIYIPFDGGKNIMVPS